MVPAGLAETGRLWPVTAMMRTISKAKATMMKAWRFLGTRPAGLGGFVFDYLFHKEISLGPVMAASVECHPLLAHHQVSACR